MEEKNLLGVKILGWFYIIGGGLSFLPLLAAVIAGAIKSSHSIRFIDLIDTGLLLVLISIMSLPFLVGIGMLMLKKSARIFALIALPIHTVFTIAAMCWSVLSRNIIEDSAVVSSVIYSLSFMIVNLFAVFYLTLLAVKTGLR